MSRTSLNSPVELQQPRQLTISPIVRCGNFGHIRDGFTIEAQFVHHLNDNGNLGVSAFCHQFAFCFFALESMDPSSPVGRRGDAKCPRGPAQRRIWFRSDSNEACITRGPIGTPARSRVEVVAGAFFPPPKGFPISWKHLGNSTL